MLRGNTAGAMDIVAQRLKALERSIVDSSWATARWMELIPTGDAHLTLQAEALIAQKLEKADRELRKGA